MKKITLHLIIVRIEQLPSYELGQSKYLVKGSSTQSF